MKKIALLLTFLAAVSLSMGQLVLYDGSSFQKDFGNGSGELDSTAFSPNSAVTSSANLTIGNDWGSITIFDTATIAPNEIDWSNGTLSFDYRINDDNNFFQVQLRIWTPSTNHITVATGGSVTTLINDGEWHTHEINISDWSTDYYNNVETNIIDPTVPADFRLTIQAAAGGLDANIDNILIPQAIPEPSFYAALFGFAAIGLAIVRRRK